MDGVAVVGGGLAGLVAARHLADAGVEVTVFEREADVGGRVRSTREDGYVFDRGFQVLFTAYPAAKRELDYDALDLRRFTPGAVICREGTRSVLSDPLRDPRAAFETVTTRVVTLRDKLRVLAERRRLARTPVEEIFDGEETTIAAALDRRGFSARFIERFAAPFYGGITLDRTLSSSSRVFDFTFKMLSAGDIAVPARGMAAIPEQLADAAVAAGATVETDRPVEAVAADGDVVEVTTATETVTADAAVVATDPPSARDLTGVESIPTAARGCVTQYYALPGEYDLQSGGRILLNADGERPNQVVPVSAVAPEQAPDDVTLVSATFLGTPEATDDALAGMTADALADWYPEFSPEALSVVHTARVPFAQFAQPPGFQADLPGPRAAGPPVYLAGDYTELASINAALASGRRAARAAREDLEAGS
jgi:phytoene dehydrogenase-like protein